MILIKLDIEQFPKQLYLKYHENKFAIRPNSDTEPKTIISGPIKAFVTYALTQDISLAQKSGLVIDGDLGQLEQLKHELADGEFDLIELITPYTGDIVANELEKIANSMKTNLPKVADNFGNMIADYVVHEKNLVVTQDELEDFADKVYALRDDIEKLEIRIAKCLN